MRTKMLKLAQALTLPVVLLASWWYLSRDSTSLYFPPLHQIADAFQEWVRADFQRDVFSSLRNLAIGYVIALGLGVALGVLLGLVRRASSSTGPLIHFLRSIPPPAILPMCVLFFGVGPGMKIAVIAFGSVWPILLATMDGIRGINNALLDTARVFSLSRWRRVTRVILPGASPLIFSGMRTALAIAVILIVISEMVASTSGVGYYILSSQRFFALPQMWAGTLFMGLLGFILSAGLAWIQRRAIKWTD